MKSPASFRSRPSSSAAIGASLVTLLLAGSTLGACGLSDGIDGLFASGSTTGGSSSASSSSSGSGGASSSSSSSSGSGAGGATSSSSSGSGAGGATSSSSSGSGAGGTGAGGNIPPPEDCLDGIDNDGNGLTDCADPACDIGFECVSPLPGSWAGYYRVHEVPFPEAAPAPCPPGTQAEAPLYLGPADAPDCSACACGDVTGAKCGLAPLSCWSGSNSCGGNGNGWTDALKDGNCHKPNNLLGFNNQLSCKVDGDTPLLAAGTCAAGGGELTNPTPWATQVDVCKTVQTGKGCGNGQACIPRGSNDPGESLCVKKDGLKDCPNGWKATTLQPFVGGTDSRACTACSCGDPGTSCDPTTYVFHDLNNCGDSDPPVTIDSGGCGDVSPLLDSFSWSAKANLPQPSSAGCAPSGGEPTGELKPDAPVTFCCK